MSTVKKSFLDKKIESGHYGKNPAISESSCRKKQDSEQSTTLPEPSQDEQGAASQ